MSKRHFFGGNAPVLLGDQAAKLAAHDPSKWGCKLEAVQVIASAQLAITCDGWYGWYGWYGWKNFSFDKPAKR